MDEQTSVNAFQWLDNAKLNRFHRRLLVLVTLAFISMGLTAQTVAYILPLVLKEWRLTLVEAGSIASYTFVGLLVGAAGFGMLSDRMGRKKTLVIALCVSGIFNGAAFFAPGYSVFCTLRFLAGLGLGGIPPLSITILSELVPARIRGKVVATVASGFPFGWALAGGASMFIIPASGWRTMLLVGGLFALVIGFLLAICLPESIRFLAGKGRYHDATREMRKIEGFSGLTPVEWSFGIAAPLPKQAKGSLRQLLGSDLAAMTILLWLSYFITMIAVHGLSTWLPQLFVKAGYSLVKSYSFGIVQSLCSLPGGFFLGFLLDRFGRKRGLFAAYLLSGFSILMFGMVSSPFSLYLAGMATGLFVLPLPSALHVISGEIYPTRIRATGVGWTQVASRVGSILGPITGGLVQMSGASFQQFFIIFSLPCFVCLILVFFFRIDVKTDALEVVTSKLLTKK